MKPSYVIAISPEKETISEELDIIILILFTFFTTETTVYEPNDDLAFRSCDKSLLFTDWIGTWNTISSVWVELSFIKSSNVDFLVVFV